MEYREIVAVTGLTGLYQLLATKSDGAIVRNLADKTTKFISARLHNVTPLESIEIYTTGDNVRLHEVLKKMQDSQGETPIIDGGKSDNAAIKAYFQKVYPEFDEERVYVSDMKKMLKWYELLKANDLLNFEALEKAQAEAKANDESTEAEEEAPAKKAKAKKTEEEETNSEDTTETPAKKTRAKKATTTEEGSEEAPKKTTRKKKTEE